MDPDATLARLLDALTRGDLDEAFAAFDDLTTWISSGGFLPTDPRQEVSP